MRMWSVDPSIMCGKHLIAEHAELHMFLGILRKTISVKGYIEGNMLEPRSILSRHFELVTEMESRGYKHNSPMNLDIDLLDQLLEYLPEKERDHRMDRLLSRQLLFSRCFACREFYLSVIKRTLEDESYV